MVTVTPASLHHELCIEQLIRRVVEVRLDLGSHAATFRFRDS
jgi:hypothetical protein